MWSVQVNAQGSPIIRGQIGNRILYLWDGIRINNGALFAGPNGFFNQFPIGSVQRMEVLRGPGAVQYGSDAIGGVINIISTAADPFALETGTHGRAGVRYGTVDDERTVYADMSQVSDRFAATVGVSGQQVDDYHGPGGDEIENTGFESYGGHAGLGFRLTDHQTVRVSLVGNERQDVESYAQSKLNPSGLPRFSSPYERRWIASGEYAISDLGAASERLAFSGYYQDFSQDRKNINENATLIRDTTTHTDQSIVGAGLQNSGHLGSVKITTGADARFENLASDKTLDTTTKATGAVVSTVPNGNTPDGTYDVLALFAIADVPLRDDVTLRLGGRYEQTHLQSDPAPEDALAPFTVDDLRLNKTWEVPTGSLGLIWQTTPEWAVTGNVAMGVRVPTYSDALNTGVPVFATGIASVPSPDVEPEHSITYEISLRHDSSVGWGSLTGYYTQLDDLLVSVDDGTITVPGVGTVTAQKRVNKGRGYVTGAEFEIGVRITDNWTAFGNATWTRGQDTDADVPLRFIPPLNGLVGLRRDSDSRRWWTEGVVVLVDRLRRHAPQDEIDAGFSTDPGLGSPNTTTNPPLRSDYDIPGYVVVNLRAGWHINQHLDATLGLNNLFDTTYREAYAQQQLVAPGFGAVIGVEGNF